MMLRGYKKQYFKYMNCMRESMYSKKSKLESRGSLLEIYERAEQMAQSQSSLQDNLLDKPYNGMFDQIPGLDPLKIIDEVISGCHESLLPLLLRHPSLGGRTPVETILSLPDSAALEFPDLAKAKKILTHLKETVSNNYMLFLQAELYGGSGNMMEVQCAGIAEMLGAKKRFHELAIAETFKGDEVAASSIAVVKKALLTVSRLVPDKYKSKIPPLTLVVRDAHEKPAGAVLDGDDAVIILNVWKNNIVQAAEALHEYVHLVEKFNPKVMRYSNEFLKLRRASDKKVLLGQTAQRYNLPYKNSAADIDVYEGHFLDVYAGRTYGDVDGADAVPSEVLTVGCEALFLDPASLFIKDRNYFNFVAKFLKGEI
jgi:hypothetical protein